MNIRIIFYSILGIPLGIFLFIFGGYDDSPGAQGLGLLVVILSIVGIIRQRRKKKDVIIVLAGGINNDGSLPNIPKVRVDRGVQCFKNNKAKTLVMTGNYGFWLDWKKEIPPRSEASAMKEYAVTQGIPENAIIMEENSKDTLGNAYFTKVNILEPRGWKNILVITSDFHLERTKYIFDLVLGSEYHIEYDAVETPVPEEEKKKLLEQEIKTIKIIKYLVGENVTAGDTESIKKIIYNKHPGYSTNPEYSYEKLRELLGRN